MNSIELVAVRYQELDRVPLMKLEWVSRLRADVDADDLEANVAVALTSASFAAVEVKDPHSSSISWTDSTRRCERSNSPLTRTSRISLTAALP